MEFPDRPNAGGNFLKLKDGESVKGVFAGNPVFFENHYKGGRCLGPGCPHCATGSKAAFRFRINFITRNEAGYVAKIFEQSGRTYDDIKNLSTDFDLSQQIIKITRKGSTQQDTRYMIMPAAEGKTTDYQKAEMGQVSLHPLVEGARVDSPPPNGSFDENEISF